MSKALYRKYRSKSLQDVVGQDHITDILSRALKADRVAHAYLFTGPRGVGKTSIARILAHEINQLPYDDDTTHLDIIEIDAASNNGVEDVRDLREKVHLAPVSAKKKVYIIDEVHMLSKPAFNALLKTLEEPPEHIVFILATTDAQKLPATIISRTQQYAFRAIKPVDAVKHLKSIAKEEKISISDEALALIAERGDGSFRDSISLLDQLTSLTDGEEITASLIQASLGLAPTAVVDSLITAAQKHDVATIARTIDEVIADGINIPTLVEQLTRTVSKLAIPQPQLLPLLDTLLDVPKSSHPSLKLLSVLGTFALEHKPVKAAALAAPVLEITATIEELSRQATRPTPKVAEANIEIAIKPTKASQEKPGNLTGTFTNTLQPENNSASNPEIVPGTKPLEKVIGQVSSDFNWETFVEEVKKSQVAIYSLLVKCGHELSEGKLTLYTGNAFYKKKLDDAKYSTHLYNSLHSLGVYQLTIHTIPTPAPLKDSQAASVAAIMGGGEEVSLSDAA